MSDFLGSLLARSGQQSLGVRPRLTSIFEPISPANDEPAAQRVRHQPDERSDAAQLVEHQPDQRSDAAPVVDAPQPANPAARPARPDDAETHAQQPYAQLPEQAQIEPARPAVSQAAIPAPQSDIPAQAPEVIQLDPGIVIIERLAPAAQRERPEPTPTPRPPAPEPPRQQIEIDPSLRPPALIRERVVVREKEIASPTAPLPPRPLVESAAFEGKENRPEAVENAPAQQPARQAGSFEAIITPVGVPALRPAPAADRQLPLVPLESEAPAPIIEVTIGRIEVRAAPPAEQPARERKGQTVMSLEEYMRQRIGDRG